MGFNSAFKGLRSNMNADLLKKITKKLIMASNNLVEIVAF